MSLVGSLEDLGLGDILQIISLSGKSGVLVLRAEGGEGKILFDQGRIRSAAVRGGPLRLSELLEQRGLAPPPAASAEDVETAVHEHVEGCVLQMFTWPTGEFSFEVGDASPHEPDGLTLDPGLNPQFLALEGTRQADEFAAGLGGRGTVVAEPTSSDQAADPFEAPAAPVELEPIEDAPEAAQPVTETPHAAEPERPAASPAAVDLIDGPPPPLPPLVLVDPDLAVIEWVRDALSDQSGPAHLFQNTDQGVGRIRQYLRRGEVPLVVLSTDSHPDPVSGARSPAEMVERLARQAPQMRILMLEQVGRPVAAGLEARTHGRLSKPAASQLADPRAAPARQRLGQELVGGLMEAVGREAPRLPDLAPAVEDLRDMSARLRESAASGEVLPRVMEFAGRIFRRVALFVIRDEEVQGIAQSGLPAAGGPDDAAIVQVAAHVSECPDLRKVIEHRAPVCLRGDEDAGGLAARLGVETPLEAWLAPIESADRVVALVYGDMLPDADPLPDTAALEVVLHHAGLALDRAALERALEEPA